MRMNYYPPCPEPEKAIGFTPHSDPDALTIPYQLNDTEGLQIRKDGRWIPITASKCFCSQHRRHHGDCEQWHL
ncbi:hypothetical protein Patl1_10093 [Pistacia atlantica]|uniref:Uncharacterized protein n=1 Tax=Pistacia atlantica TaxID=434234 RepID=A0ACC1A6Z8_9ROSI|nr:hypothetical protein Patl1_10093 [Pistacia atlantica]